MNQGYAVDYCGARSSRHKAKAMVCLMLFFTAPSPVCRPIRRRVAVWKTGHKSKRQGWSLRAVACVLGILLVTMTKHARASGPPKKRFGIYDIGLNELPLGNAIVPVNRDGGWLVTLTKSLSVDRSDLWALEIGCQQGRHFANSHWQILIAKPAGKQFMLSMVNAARLHGYMWAGIRSAMSKRIHGGDLGPGDLAC